MSWSKIQNYIRLTLLSLSFSTILYAALSIFDSQINTYLQSEQPTHPSQLFAKSAPISHLMTYAYGNCDTIVIIYFFCLFSMMLFISPSQTLLSLSLSYRLMISLLL
jgi:hypothetical protein